MPDRLIETLSTGEPLHGLAFALNLYEHQPILVTAANPAQWRLVAFVDGEEAGRVCIPRTIPLTQARPTLAACATFLVNVMNALGKTLALKAITDLQAAAGDGEPS